MKRIKDIFYDMNDIMVALIIVALAALVIVTNINSILDYPSYISETIQVPEKETPTNYAENPPVSNQGSTDAAVSQGTTGAGVDNPNTAGGENSGQSNPDSSGSGKVENYSVYINTGSTGAQIADLMIQVGLFKDRQSFYNAVTAAGADGKLKAGNFIIPSNSTPAEVVAILTR